jgi:hypothetical protein
MRLTPSAMRRTLKGEPTLSEVLPIDIDSKEPTKVSRAPAVVRNSHAGDFQILETASLMELGPISSS